MIMCVRDNHLNLAGSCFQNKSPENPPCATCSAPSGTQYLAAKETDTSLRRWWRKVNVQHMKLKGDDMSVFCSQLVSPASPGAKVSGCFRQQKVAAGVGAALVNSHVSLPLPSELVMVQLFLQLARWPWQPQKPHRGEIGAGFIWGPWITHLLTGRDVELQSSQLEKLSSSFRAECCSLRHTPPPPPPPSSAALDQFIDQYIRWNNRPCLIR